MTDTEDNGLRGQLRSLVEVLQASTSSLLPNATRELLDSIVEAAAMIFGAQAASIALIRGEGELEFVSSFGVGRDEIIGRRMPVDRGIAGFVALTGQALAISDVEKDPRFDKEFAASTGYLPTSILAAPLELRDQVVGVMEVLDKVDAPGFAMQDLELMAIFGRQAALAIEQSEMLDDIGLLLRQGLTELALREQQTVVDRLVDALEPPGVEARSMTDLAVLSRHIGRLYAAGELERQVCLDILSSLTRYLDQKDSLG